MVPDHGVSEVSEALGRWWRRSASCFESLAAELARRTAWKVFNPGLYGERWHARFRRAYPLRHHPLLFCGLNPGPYGMAQTGVPFTDLKRLASHLPKLSRELAAAGEPVGLPGLAPPQLRPFLTRTFESSSVRVYRFLDRAYGSAEAAFRAVVFVNPCPLLFIDPATGANRTPADLPKQLRGASGAAPLLARFEELRRASVAEAIEQLAPRGVVLFGRNVAAAVGPRVRERLAPQQLVEWAHPARAVPDRWARGLEQELESRRLLR